MGGMIIPVFSEFSENEYIHSTSITEGLVNKFVKQERKYMKNPEISSVENGIKKNNEKMRSGT